MAMIVLPKEFHPDFASPGVKPTGPVELEKPQIFHTLLRDSTRDDVSGLSPDFRGDSSLTAPKGLKIRGGTATSNGGYVDYNVGNFLPVGGYTVFCKVKFVSGPATTSGGDVICEKPYTSAAEPYYAFQLKRNRTSISESLSYQFSLGGVRYAGGIGLTSEGDLTLGKTAVIALGVRNGEQYVLMLTSDGTFREDYHNNTGTVNDYNTNLRLGGSKVLPGNGSLPKNIEYFRISNFVSAAEAKAFLQDPYQILKPAEPMFYFTAAGGPSTQTLLLTSIATSEVFGQPSVGFDALTVSMSAIASGEAFGQIVVDPSRTVSPSAIASLEAFGLNQVTTGAVTVSTLGISSEENMGLISVVTGTSVKPAGIATSEALGSPSVQTLAVDISPTGIGSLEKFGLPTVPREAITVSVTSASAGEVMGEPLIEVGAVTISANSANAGESMGEPQVQLATLYVRPEGVYSGMRFGRIVLVGGDFVYVSSDYAIISSVVTGVVQSVVTSLAA